MVNIIEAYDHWVAFGLLAIVGGRMLWESFHSEEEPSETDVTKGLPLLVLSVATSIDSLGVGLSLAFVRIDILRASLVIGIVAFAVTATGFLLGKKVGELFGKRAKLTGGVILIAIGLRILITHVL